MYKSSAQIAFEKLLPHARSAKELQMYCYAIAPIDFWSGWMSYDQLGMSIASDFHSLRDVASTYQELQALFEEGKKYARERLGWEGDMSQGPFFAGIPQTDVSSPAFMIAWKQSNNGTTFVVSPKPLAWLREG